MFENCKLNLAGVAPFRRGEFGGNRLSNNSGLRWPPNETLFLFIGGSGNGSSSPLLRFFGDFLASSTSEVWTLPDCLLGETLLDFAALLESSSEAVTTFPS